MRATYDPVFDAEDLNRKGSEGKVGRKSALPAKMNPEALEEECNQLLVQMETAYLDDLDSNQHGKPGLAKFQILDKVVLKLKNSAFATMFLDRGGLEQLHSFLRKLPDGSWPLSPIRSKVYSILLTLPYNEFHLKHTRLGKTLTTIESSGIETPENKRVIAEIKLRWSRIVIGIRQNYSQLEDFERTNARLMKKKVHKGSMKRLRKEAEPGEAGRVNFSFVLTQQPGLSKREPGAPDSAKTEEITKFLTRMRRNSRPGQ